MLTTDKDIILSLFDLVYKTVRHGIYLLICHNFRGLGSCHGIKEQTAVTDKRNAWKDQGEATSLWPMSKEN